MTSDPSQHNPAHEARNAPGSLKKRAIHSSAWTLGGYGAQQIVRLGGNYILTLLLAPATFGLMALVNMVLELLQKFSDIGINQSIIRDQRGDDRDFLNTAWTVGIVRGGLIWLAACVLTWPVARFYDRNELLALIPIAALTALIAGFRSTKIATTNRHLMLKRLTVLELGSRILGTIAMIVWAGYSPTAWALVAGGIITALVVLAGSFLFLPGPGNRVHWDRDAANELIRFGKWIILSTAITFFLAQGDKMTLGKLMDENRFGIYAIAFMLARAVPEMILKLAPRVLMPVYARLIDQGPKRLRSQTRKMRLVLMGISLPILWILVLFGRSIIRIYPAEYHEAGWMLEILAAGNIGLVIGITAGGITLARGDSFRFMVLQIGRAVLMIAGMWIGYHFGSERGLMIGMGVSYWANYPLLVWAIRPHGTWLPKVDALAFGASAVVIALRVLLG
ncbi:MAG: oligosaccharide flippase family protein [Phycisphaerales bacterium]|nr:oligosaccharide flippase family protein [Phycisphaerales bacterium]